MFGTNRVRRSKERKVLIGGLRIYRDSFQFYCRLAEDGQSFCFNWGIVATLDLLFGLRVDFPGEALYVAGNGERSGLFLFTICCGVCGIQQEA